VLGKIIRNRVPRCARIYISVKLRPNPRVIVEGAHPNGNLRTLGPVAAKQTRAAGDTKRFHRSLTFSVNADQFLACEQVELLPRDAHLRANSRSRMLPATIAMAVVRPEERRLRLETYAAAKATAPNPLTHKII
jgi:hypothetical protein